jgi:hypothetical protein
MKPCTCGHSVEEHGPDLEHPGSRACDECDCIAYEADEDYGDEGVAAVLAADEAYASFLDRVAVRRGAP